VIEGEATRPAYRVVTPRLVIRCWDPADAPLMKAAVDGCTSHLRPWMPWATLEPAPLENRIQWLRKCRGEFDLGSDFVYGVFDLTETEVIGGTGLHTRRGPDVREIGYWIHERYARKGFATEVTAALTRVAFEIEKMSRVEIHVAVENFKSIGVPRKLGYRHEGTLRERIKDAAGVLHDSMIWTMLAAEYPGSVPSSAEMEAFDVMGRRFG
jgi:RimJ/RimL family protein N-acetyltransferase